MFLVLFGCCLVLGGVVVIVVVFVVVRVFWCVLVEMKLGKDDIVKFEVCFMVVVYFCFYGCFFGIGVLLLYFLCGCLWLGCLFGNEVILLKFLGLVGLIGNLLFLGENMVGIVLNIFCFVGVF